MGESNGVLAYSGFVAGGVLEPDAAAPSCRSQYAEEFRDSQGFGWQDASEHKFDWQTLVNKKVVLVSCSRRLSVLCILHSELAMLPR